MAFSSPVVLLCTGILAVVLCDRDSEVVSTKEAWTNQRFPMFRRGSSDFPTPTEAPASQARTPFRSHTENASTTQDQKSGGPSKRATILEKEKENAGKPGYDPLTIDLNDRNNLAKRNHGDVLPEGRLHGDRTSSGYLTEEGRSYHRDGEHSRSGIFREDRRMTSEEILKEKRIEDATNYHEHDSHRKPHHTDRRPHDGFGHETHRYHEGSFKERHESDRRSHIDDTVRGVHSYRDDRRGTQSPDLMDYPRRNHERNWDERGEARHSVKEHVRTVDYDVKEKDLQSHSHNHNHNHNHHDGKPHTIDKPLVININDCCGPSGGRCVHKFIIKPRPAPCPCPPGPHSHLPHSSTRTNQYQPVADPYFKYRNEQLPSPFYYG